MSSTVLSDLKHEAEAKCFRSAKIRIASVVKFNFVNNVVQAEKIKGKV